MSKLRDPHEVADDLWDMPDDGEAIIRADRAATLRWVASYGGHGDPKVHEWLRRLADEIDRGGHG